MSNIKAINLQHPSSSAINLVFDAAGNSVHNGNVSATGTVADNVGTIRPLVSGTSQASTSGTNIDFTGIPLWVKRITLMLNGVSTTGTSIYQVQVGSGSVLTSGYSAGLVTAQAAASSGAVTPATTGFYLINTLQATDVHSGHFILTNLSGNIWVGSGILLNAAGSRAGLNSGSISLGGALDRIRLTTVNGTDTFDAGSVNILYE